MEKSPQFSPSNVDSVTVHKFPFLVCLRSNLFIYFSFTNIMVATKMFLTFYRLILRFIFYSVPFQLVQYSSVRLIAIALIQWYSRNSKSHFARNLLANRRTCY